MNKGIHRKPTLLMIALAGAASAATVGVQPYDGARFVAGQQFDLRVEVSGLKNVKSTVVTLDGKPVTGLAVTPGRDGGQNHMLRGLSLTRGQHTLAVTVTDDAGTTTRSATWTAEAPTYTARPAKNVILFIADGMGWNTVNAARIIARGYNAQNGNPNGLLSMETGLGGMATVTTSSYDSFLADSANTASSIATGQKVLVNALNVYPDNTDDALDNPRVETITEMLRRLRGAGVGLVSTAFGVDATPAAFAAHTRRRGDYQAIADQYFQGPAKPDVMLFGGSRDFIPSTAPGSRRRDDRNWIDESQKLGFQFVSNRTELLNAGGTKLFGLFNIDNVPSYLDRAQYRTKDMLGDFTDMPYLWDMTQKAVQTLEKNPNGFFLMVEAGMVDKYEHPLDWQRGVWDVLELDRAVDWAKQYARQHPDTLVLVTADHAHSISAYAGYDSSKQGREGVTTYEKGSFPTYTSKLDANGIPFPQTARGVAVGFAGTPDYCETYGSGPVFLDPTVSDGKGGFVPNPKICETPGAVRRVGNLGPADAQGVHSADPMPLFAFGAGAQNFTGMMDQTDIFFAIARSMNLARAGR
ncbi:alkaline phosphatase [Deinococcus pimensis]|uniref:alkaline phosphatase n=1 Tax=Deinococcus pimensis TaxID=309888 RepID=UPI0005EBC02C|nr:alkaline phosphatase [Deinococcus pimensis]